MTDDDTPRTTQTDAERIAELEARIHAIKRDELTRWADAVVEAQRLFDEVDRMRGTVSWRVTAPLRVYRRKQLGS